MNGLVPDAASWDRDGDKIQLWLLVHGARGRRMQKTPKKDMDS